MQQISILWFVFAISVISSGGSIQADDPMLQGEYGLVTLRRASDVAGGGIGEDIAGLIGSTVKFGKKLEWLGQPDCDTWSVENSRDNVVNISDPMLSDTQISPAETAALGGDKRLNINLNLLCGNRRVSTLLKVDQRILVVPTASGTEYMIFERPMSGGETSKFQQQLRSMKFYSGPAAEIWNDASLSGLSSFAESRGAQYRFLRAAITENLLGGLAVFGEDDCPDVQSCGRGQGYQQQLSAGSVLEYRPGLNNRLRELQPVSEETLTQSVTTLSLLVIDASANPGRWVQGNVALGAELQEYEPTDEELLAAEYGDRLADFVSSKDAVDLVEAWDGEALLPFPMEYFRFDYRHADVMGSGRYFYASKPVKAVINVVATGH